jgi:hypothetical protein
MPPDIVATSALYGAMVSVLNSHWAIECRVHGTQTGTAIRSEPPPRQRQKSIPCFFRLAFTLLGQQILLRKQIIMSLSAEKRKALTTKLNGMIDVPFLNEDQEAMVADALINALVKPLAAALPSDADMTNMARSSGEESMQKSVKQSVVEKMNKKINIPGVGEAQEAMVFSMVVDFVLKDKFEEIHRSLSAAAPTTAAAPAAAAGAEATTTTTTSTTGESPATA